MSAKADNVFLGDSLTYYGDFSSVFPDKVVCNLGSRGDTILGMIDRVEQVRILELSKVFLMAGINDINDSINEFELRYSRLVKALLYYTPLSSLVIQSILPVNTECFSVSCDNQRIESFNRKLIRIANCFHLNYIDLFSEFCVNGTLPESYTIDGIHLRAEGYVKWCSLIRYCWTA